MMTAALRAIPFPHRYVFGVIVLVATDMTYLTAWIPFVYLDKLLTLPCKFVFQHTCEHAPAIVGYGFTKAELATLLSLRHGLYANVLYANRIIFIYQIASFLMQEVAALISNFLMEYSHTQSLFMPVTAPFLPFG